MGTEILARGGTVYSGATENRILHTTKIAEKFRKSKKSLPINYNHRRLSSHDVDYSSLTLKEMQAKRESLHDDLFDQMMGVRDDLDLVLYISAVTFLLPVCIFCKFVFTQLTKRKYHFTVTDYLDIVITTLVVWLWVVIERYESSDLIVPLFNSD